MMSQRFTTNHKAGYCRTDSDQNKLPKDIIFCTLTMMPDCDVIMGSNQGGYRDMRKVTKFQILTFLPRATKHCVNCGIFLASKRSLTPNTSCSLRPNALQASTKFSMFTLCDHGD